MDGAFHWLGVFDGGIHVFSRESWISGLELRVRRTVVPGTALVAVAPELSYGVAYASHSYPSSAYTELWLQRVSAGARTSVHDARLRGVTPFVRLGATGLWGTALAHDLYRNYREEALGYGAYGAAGAELDLGRVGLRGPRMTVGFEVGHLYTGGLSFARMGTLDVNGVFYSSHAALRF